ncbi:serine/threonine-protein kinase [Actinomadura fulvescens]|uniref:non-specific serine/threonine protein kinase n=1 Tax=Actinomadura fulvescens TaxID=46160 RepID=A0ABP6BW93_9ACTN
MTEWRVTEFEEVRELGRGAQGRVVLARHAERGTPVAIKYLPADADDAAKERFRYEARMLGQVDNPHVAKLYRLVESDEGIAIIMEAVEGVAFKTILERYGRLEPEAALTVLKGSLAGLAAAHAAGVVHRDYKPANVVVRADGLSKLIDFGIASFAGTTAGSGTPVYMAPEQWRGGSATPATDVYAATCVFFECVTGERPYRGDLAALRHAHLEMPVPLEQVDEPLRHLVARGMAKQAGQRPASASAFIAELEETARRAYGSDWESRGVRVLATSAVAFAALFPLAAAGLAPAGTAAAMGSTAATSSTGVMSALGTKATVAIAGTAVVGTTAGVFGVYELAKPDDTRRPAATATTLAPGRDVTFGKLSLRLPLNWKSHPLPVHERNSRTPLTYNYRVNVPGPCRVPKIVQDNDRREGKTREQDTYYNNYCPSFAVIVMPFRNDGELGWDTFKITSTFAPDTEAAHVCPPRADLYGVGGQKLVKRGLAPVGGRQAEYREWQIRCAKIIPRYEKSNVSFVHRLWYLPQSKVLIVDEWNTPNLGAILEKAVWR